MNDRQSCLHCVLSEIMNAYIIKYEITDSTILYAALADMVGDLMSDSEDMFSGREEIMKSFNVRAMDRARIFMEAMGQKFN